MPTGILIGTSYTFSPFALPLWFVGVAMLVLGVVVLVSERDMGASIAFFLVNLSAALWLLAYGAAYSSIDEEVALWWIRMVHVGVVFLPSFLYFFTLVITRQVMLHQKFIWLSLALSAFFCFQTVFSDALISGVHRYPWGYYALFGPLGTAFLFFFFGILVISLGLLWRSYIRAVSGSHEKRLRSFLLAYLVGYLGVVDYIANYGVGVYPMGYLAIFGFLILAARTIRRYHLVDITPAFASEQIMGIMSDAVIVLDGEGTINFVNQAACDIFGYKEKELVGKTAKSVLGGILSSGPLADLIQAEIVRDYQVEYPSKSGPRIFSFSASIMKDEDKNLVAFVFVVRDITKRKKAEELVIKRTEELTRSKAELEQLELFAFVASHDLQEPLRKIIAFGDRLKNQIETQVDSSAKDSLDRMTRAAARMSSYLQDLVEFTRVTTKVQPFERVNLQNVVREVLADLELPITELKADIQVVGLVDVMADRLQMQQLFQNIIANALKFSQKDKKPKIVIQGKRLSDGFAEITVQDNGIGFDQKYSDKIFKPFERLHSRQEFEGSGMGLAICQRIVLRHHGKINVKSVPGEGTIFIITLPSLSFGGTGESLLLDSKVNV